MHDGSLKTLKDVIDFYVGGGTSNPQLDKEIHTLVHLTGREREDLLAFLESLTGEFPYEVGPPAKASAPPPAREQAKSSGR
jgi:cytochrome c peroxidase